MGPFPCLNQMICDLILKLFKKIMDYTCYSAHAVIIKGIPICMIFLKYKPFMI